MSEAVIEGLKALGHPLRFRILQALAEGERNVGDIETASGIGQPALSQQLAFLRKAELVTTRREAKSVFYAIDDERLGEIRQAVDALRPAAKPGDLDAQKLQMQRTGAAVFARLNI